MNSWLYKQKALKDASYAKAKVTYLRNSKGIRVSLVSFITYQFVVDGQKIEGNQKAEEGLSPVIGDCIEIIYSR
ncbi:hypothetical protein [Hymenobacter roseosalivarius]|uniref:hypothetical protein n=1 Tax=Hymenobacter roseosalivarius TaxID=89967 RepID=UPI0009FDE623|nr:hypothetical protein [Hymenobacter roseosalivarius]